MVKSIFLQDGEEIIVDDQDYERVNQYIWYKSFKGGTRYIRSENASLNGKYIGLTNFIIENSYQKIKNNDFTRNNLTTKGNHARWARPMFNSSSRYKGVSWAKRVNKWHASIRVQEKIINLGYFLNEWEAAKAYNNAVDYYWDGQGFKNVKDQPKRQAPEKSPKRSQRRTTSKNNANGFRGVKKTSNSPKPYRAYLKFHYKEQNLGRFKDKNQAALAYNKTSLYLYGEDNAILNDVPMTNELKEFITNWEIPTKIKALKEGAGSE